MADFNMYIVDVSLDGSSWPEFSDEYVYRNADGGKAKQVDWFLFLNIKILLQDNLCYVASLIIVFGRRTEI